MRSRNPLPSILSGNPSSQNCRKSARSNPFVCHSYETPRNAHKTRRFKSIPYHSYTLSRYKSFACHSYEKHRGCTPTIPKSEHNFGHPAAFLPSRPLCYLASLMTKRIGVLLSGRGSNFEALAESVAADRIPNAEIAIVISNREGAPGIERARARGIKTLVIPSKGLEREAYDRQVVAALQEKKVDLVCLAGFMRLLSPYFIAAFPGRILNIHPSLLPAFPGLEAQRQALGYGVKFTGCSVHFVDENLDAGPIVAQAVVPVRDDDTAESLSERILREEHRIYSEAVRVVLEGRFRIQGRRVILSS